jgi:hypothetical protein
VAVASVEDGNPSALGFDFGINSIRPILAQFATAAPGPFTILGHSSTGLLAVFIG